MASETLVSESVDPLSGLEGPSLFPRTIRAAADGPIPADAKDLDSINNFMKSLEFKSPEKLMNEAKRIVDGGMELLESKFANFAEKVGITDAVAAKDKDRLQERRQGLGLARKRGSFALKTSVSQSSVCLESTLNINQLEDPDEYFDAYERGENAKKEIQKQWGGRTENLNQNKPPINARGRRPGILGKERKSFNLKSRYSSVPSESIDALVSSQETMEQELPSAPEGDSQEVLAGPVPHQDPDVDMEEVELAASMNKMENKVSDILDELLSCDNEDLDGDGALNLLKERLKIKPLDMESLFVPERDDVGRNSVSSAGESSLNYPRSSRIINSVLKNVNNQSSMEHEQVAQNSVNPAFSPTPPRSPFASLSLLKKRILQSNPLKDPFSPLDISACESPAQPNDNIHEQAEAPKDLNIASEFESHVEVEVTEPTIPNTDAAKVVESSDGFADQFADENAIIRQANADNGSSEQPDYNTVETMNFENLNGGQSTPLHEDDAINNQSGKRQLYEEQLPEVRTEPQDDEREAGDQLVRKTHPKRKRLADRSRPSDPKDVVMDDPSITQIDPEQPEVHQGKSQRRKREVNEKRIQKAHPMRKSLAESGTSFETGVRRSKRIKMRPLEYWKGERFLYGRVDDSLKLLGVKYISPGKDHGNLKVKPLLSESSKYKELLELAAKH